jgi:hypothetical protein
MVIFLTAAWRNLAILNYEISPSILQPFVPAGTVLDFYEGRCFASVVAFQFQNTRVLRLGVPFHRDFEEVNLRFYVRRESGNGVRRGVVFIREIVPRRAIAFVASAFYNEPYISMPMSSEIGKNTVAYRWGSLKRSNSLHLQFEGQPCAAVDGSVEQFITEHYWGYTKQRDGGTIEYEVAHPKWRLWHATEARLNVDAATLYGSQFTDLLASEPASAFLADGSNIAVYSGRRIC